MPKPDEHQGTMTVEPTRLRVIRQRLENAFYEVGSPSDHIAAAVLAAVKDLDRASLPH